MLKHFNTQWDTVPLCVIDTECTGKQPGLDRAVSFGLARFENGVFVGGLEKLVNPGMAISAEATEIHHITADMVVDAPTIEEAFFQPDVLDLLEGAQPAAYNAPFDRHFVPPFGPDWTWPWLDGLAIVRKVDRFAKGKGRHKLSVACARHGISLTAAHSAGADARAAGELIYKLGREVFSSRVAPLGQVLGWCRRAEAEEWERFNSWLSVQPPREEAGAA